MQARKSIDVGTLDIKPSTEDDELVDEEIFRAESTILQQLNKEHRPVSYTQDVCDKK